MELDECNSADNGDHEGGGGVSECVVEHGVGDGVAGRAVEDGARDGVGGGVFGCLVEHGDGVDGRVVELGYRDGVGGDVVERSVDHGTVMAIPSCAAKRTLDKLPIGGGFACGDNDTSPPLKRPRRQEELDDDADDLLQFLDAAYKLENAIPTDPECGHLGEQDELNVREIALEAMAIVKHRHIAQQYGSERDDEPDAIETYDDDILGHLDVAYERENAGLLKTPYEKGTSHCSMVADHELASRDVDVKGIAAFALAVTKYRHAIIAEQDANPQSNSNNDVDDIDDIEQHLLRRVQEAVDDSCKQKRRQQGARKRYQQQKEDTQSVHDRFGPISDADRAEALKHLQKSLGAEGLEECVCVSCDQLVLLQNATRKEASYWRFMNQKRRCLGKVDRALPRSLVDAYAAPACVTYLSNVMIAPDGFRCYTDGDGHPTAWFTICRACLKSIEQACMPKFAIANGFFIGKLPENLTDLTLPERFMTQLVSISAVSRVMRGGRHRCIRSHCVAFDCTPGSPVSLLPTSISDVSEFRVTMVGDVTEAQLEKVKTLHQIRTSKLRDAYDFYTRNNSLYSDVMRNDSTHLGDIDCDLLAHLILEHIEDEGGVADNSVRDELENIRGHSDAWQVNDEHDELNIVERRIALSDATKELLSHGKEVDTDAGRDAQE